MKISWLSPLLALALSTGALFPLISCQNKDPDVPNTYQFRDPGNVELQRKLNSKNAKHQNRMDRRSMRRSARDDRYDAWFDMIMQ